MTLPTDAQPRNSRAGTEILWTLLPVTGPPCLQMPFAHGSRIRKERKKSPTEEQVNLQPSQAPQVEATSCYGNVYQGDWPGLQEAAFMSVKLGSQG